jgi:serine/threonine-protein kinase
VSGDLIGKTLLGRYRVESFVGRGGMAEVYKVWDSTRSAYLAMKFLRDDLAEDRIFLRRFKREAQTLSKLQHPNIVRFYGLKQDDDLAFMLMDFVEGSTLRKEIFRAKRPFSPQRVLEIMRPVCSALHYAHQMGMVHCDAKPGNIMIESSGKVLVTDFGIARMTDAATATMVGMGTPAYMAPEQVQGKDPSPQTDIYALGVVLFEMLTGGERPFTGELAETTGSTSEKVRWEQMHLQPPSLKKWNPNITPELEEFVLRCLAKDPTERYGSVLELLNALEAALGVSVLEGEPEEPHAEPLPSEPIADQAPSDFDDTDLLNRIKSRPEVVTAVVVGAFALVLAIGLLGGGGDRSRNGPAQVQPAGVTQVIVVVTEVVKATVKTPQLHDDSEFTPKPTQPPAPEPTDTRSPTRTPTPKPRYRVGSTKVSSKDDMVLVYVPEGDFIMGVADYDPDAADREKGQSTVFLDAFWLDQTEVTNTMYKRCVQAGACRPRSFKPPRSWGELG